MRTRRRLVVVAVALCALVAIPVASAGWEGQIDFASDGGGGYVDVGPKGPSPGDFFVLDQKVSVFGLTRAQWQLQLGAPGTLKGTLSYLTPRLFRANATIKLAAGWIRISGWLDANVLNGGGGPTSSLLFTHGSGGIFTGSRGYLIINNGDNPAFSVILR